MSQTEPTRKKRIGNLATSSDIIREIKRVYREGRNDEIDTVNMSRFANVLKMLIDIKESQDIEHRLEVLENAQIQ